MKRKWIEWLISLVITLAMLGLVVAGLYWYMGKTNVQLEIQGMWWANAVGGVIMLLIVHHFVKEPEDK